MQFNLEINLDDETEAREFTAKHKTIKGRSLANVLGLKGKGADTLATALSNYAWNKVTACSLRLRGDVRAALLYEGICDHIYSQDIRPVCECW